eukprot:GHRR01002562.1.p1 GENE.GHRR01002562.1~~GHRR01002562.1.p1  ORF type:complete len:281 (+),score=54.76 GHRR01002562.1:112-954(+)
MAGVLGTNAVRICKPGLTLPARSASADTRLHAHATHHERHTQERVLRYPDGHVRYIRYPVEMTIDEEEEDSSFAAWDVSELWDTRSRGNQGAQQATGTLTQGESPSPSLQDTAEYLESLFSASYEAQPLMNVEDSYQILHGCPWVLPRSVFVLACKRQGATPEDDVRNMYTLRTKVKQEGAANALAKLLKKQHLAEALEVADMHDGVVLFEDDQDADRFASMLEEEGHSQVMLAEVHSHKLFRLATDAGALVVLLPRGSSIPAPYQLAASLKQKRSWDSL